MELHETVGKNCYLLAMAIDELLTVLSTLLMLNDIWLHPFLASCQSLSYIPSPATHYSPGSEDWGG
jgi:hypothetical protein